MGLEPGLTSHEAVHAFSVRESDRFWAALAASRLQWHQPFATTTSSPLPTFPDPWSLDGGWGCRGSLAEGSLRWFPDGRLNLSENALDRQDPDRVALIWERDEPGAHQTFTFRSPPTPPSCPIG